MKLGPLHTLSGEPVAYPTLIAQHNLHVGRVLNWPDETTRKRLDEPIQHLARHERFWQRELAAFRPTTPPYRTGTASDPQEHRHITLTLPGNAAPNIA